MNTINTSLAHGNKFAFFAARMRTLFMRHPEWCVWFFSLITWASLLIDILTTSHEIKDSRHIISCMPMGTTQVVGHSTYEIQNIFSRILTTILHGIAPWIMMVVAMMFPLLNEPIRHVAFSVRRKDRNSGILGFLIGYTIIWSVAGILFLSLPFLLNMLIGDQTQFINGLIKSSGFLLAAALIWLPGRPVRMMKCGQTMPIRIQGWQLHLDSLYYGLKMGFTCMSICWAPMAALMLTHHNVLLMYAVTVVIIYERYLLPHTSKLPGHAWGIIALTLFSIEMWA